MAREDWKIVVLEHDEGSKQIGELIGELFPDITEVAKISNYHNYQAWSKTTVREMIRKSVKAEKEQRVLTLYGSGWRHQFTYGLCREVADERSDNYAYFQFDHHTDFGIMKKNELDCGAFVNAILKDSNAQTLRYVGCYLRYPSAVEKIGKTYDFVLEDRLRKEGVEKSVTRLLQNTPNDVYISMDLDVLNHSEIRTGFSRGTLRLEDLMKVLDAIKKGKRVISADALGYKTGEFDMKSLLTYVEIVEKITDRKLDPNVKVEAVKKIRNMYEPAYEENTIERLSTLMKVKRIYEMLKSKLTDG